VWSLAPHTDELDPAPPLGNSMLLLGNEKATGRPLPAANSRKRLLPCCSLFAAFADQTAKSRNSRKRPQRIQAFLSPETGVRIPVAVLRHGCLTVVEPVSAREAVDGPFTPDMLRR
jgi:hypothetical protein